MSDIVQQENTRFIRSQDIRIFPYAQDRPTDPFGKHLNEQNLTNLVKHMCTFDSFFIGCKDVTEYHKQGNHDTNVYKLCEFMLAGHYINVIITLPTADAEASIAERAFWLNNDVYVEITHYNASDRYNERVADASTTTTVLPLDVSYLQVLGKDHVDINNLSTFQGVRFVSIPVSEQSRFPVRQTQYKTITIEDSDASGEAANLQVGARVTSLRLFEGKSADITSSDDWTTYDLESHVPDEAWIRFHQKTNAQFTWKIH